MVKRCLDIIKDFRAAKGTKFDAAYVISGIIKESLPLGSGEDPSTVAAICLSMLNEWESEQNHANQRGKEPCREQCSVEPMSSSHVEEEYPPEDIRSRQVSIEPDEPAQKQAKLNFTCLDFKPMVHREPARPLSTNLRHTICILQNWVRDQKQARLKLMYHEQSPEFHTSRWADIVAGQSINLNATIRDVQLTYGISKMATKKLPCRAIGTQCGIIRATQAIKFTFCFKQAELDAYSEHINEQFDQQLENCHGQVLQYDKSIRFRVGNTCRYELSDFKCFKDIYSSHFSTGGRLHNDSGKSCKSTDPSAKDDPCQKWNNGECTHSAATCCYAHVCNVKQDG
ncbi:hypothetical protein BDR05DRAFT_883467 [Suillus weaverae]|nr:hypothetical protein BDR05DRAFT_883467 [Suillus weaverae]